MKHFLLSVHLLCFGLLLSCAATEAQETLPPPEIRAWNVVPTTAGEEAKPARGHSLWCDRVSGHLFASNGKGIWISRDRGRTLTDAVERQEKGRHYNATGFDADWKGGRLALFAVDSPIGWITLDNGKTWTNIERPLIYPGKAKHDGWTYGAVDWTQAEPKRLFAKEHHTQNYWFTSDAGKTWSKLEGLGGYSGIGFGADGALLIGYARQTANETAKMASGIHRSEDDGKTWHLVFEAEMNQKIKPQRYDNTLYWPAKAGIARSTDGGKTWALLEHSPPNILYGPFFAETDNNMLAVSREGVWQTTDQGQSWALTMKREDFHPNVRDGNFNEIMPGFAWDWRNDLLYISSIGVPIFVGPLK